VIWSVFVGPLFVGPLLVGCGEPAVEGPPRKRFDAVMVDPSKVTPPEEFCESFATAETAKPFVTPALAGEAWKPPAGWRWVNVWATWCGPCIAEMPRLVEWQKQLEKENVPVELVFLSVDAGQPEVDRFYAKEKALPPSVRIADVAALPQWLADVGLDATTPIPIHFFVDAEGRTRCIRTGAINEGDYGAVKKVIGG
jgi:thiol-disulfide isomerase/thioredoxin